MKILVTFNGGNENIDTLILYKDNEQGNMKMLQRHMKIAKAYYLEFTYI